MRVQSRSCLTDEERIYMMGFLDMLHKAALVLILELFFILKYFWQLTLQ